MAVDNQSPKVNIDETRLDAEGFTANGKKRYRTTINDYSSEVFRRSVSYGDGSCGKGMKKEITHEHVKQAAASIAVKGARQSKLSIACQVLEYAGAVIVGVATNHLDQNIGLITFVISLVVTLLLIMMRLIKSNN